MKHFTNLADPPLVDGGYPVDNDLHQMTDDGCPLVPDPARWADPEWRDEEKMDPEARRREFGEMADGLSAKVRGTQIGSGTGVCLIYHYADRQGNGFTRQVSVAPKVYEAEVNRDAIIGTVQALIREAPTGWAFPQEPGPEVWITGFNLEIMA